MHDDLPTVKITHPFRLTFITVATWVIIIGGIMLLISSCKLDDPAAPPYDDTTTTTTTATTTTTQPATTTLQTTTVSTTTTTYDLPIEAMEMAFVLTMRDHSNDMTDVTWVDIANDDEIVEWGYLFCEVITNTGSWSTALMISMNAGENTFGEQWFADDEDMVAFGSGAAIYAFCPEYTDLIGEW